MNWNVDSAFYRSINSRFSIIEQTTVLTAAQDICSYYKIWKDFKLFPYLTCCHFKLHNPTQGRCLANWDQIGTAL